VKPQKVADTVERVGRVQAVDEVELRARVQGFLEQRVFTEGADVEQGDLLFVIERDQYEIDVARAKAQLARAKAELDNAQRAVRRSRALQQRGNVSQAALDDAIAADLQAKADVEAAEAEIRAAELNLGYTEIRAPFAGRISRSIYSPGDLVGPDSDVLATLVSLDPIHVYVEVPETVLFEARRRNTALAKKGQSNPEVTPRIRFRDGSYYPYLGAIDFRDNRINETTGTQTARAVFPNPDKLLLPGQYVEVIVQIGEEQERLVVPQAAVQEDQAGRFVLVVDDADEVSVRRVVLGDQQGIYYVVETGLSAGERVIFQGVQKVRPGMKVAPTEANPEKLVLE
jgi:membrane fusion protein (multidrug efflux system)